MEPASFDPVETLKKIALVAMAEQSNPYAPAKKYRAALIEVCNRALATLDRVEGSKP